MSAAAKEPDESIVVESVVVDGSMKMLRQVELKTTMVAVQITFVTLMKRI
jgi:hypothetical protein